MTNKLLAFPPPSQYVLTEWDRTTAIKTLIQEGKEGSHAADNDDSHRAVMCRVPWSKRGKYFLIMP